MGLGATLTFDLWGLLLKRTLQIAPSNICLVGRWLRYMPEGSFRHANIALTPRRPAECALGWIAHYLIGIAFASTFVALAGAGWLQHPTLVPAMAFGLVTVVAPFFVMQPLMGLGLASSKAANPTLARIRTLLNHLAFGAGLYWVAWLLSVL
ncbi:MAG: DUF2938 domain-containing protein [Ardenticatenia bacterium]|nr:DUF2938 domain-containing protein [Ardenticatenia bacterium]